MSDSIAGAQHSFESDWTITITITLFYQLEAVKNGVKKHKVHSRLSDPQSVTTAAWTQDANSKQAKLSIMYPNSDQKFKNICDILEDYIL